MSRVSGIMFFLLCLTLFSCGGGGGSSSAGLQYTTDWSHRLTSGQITGQSQRVNVLDSAGLPVISVILQNVAAPVESTTFDLANGDYTLQVQLFSAPNAGGVQTGILEVPISITNGRGTTVGSAVGDPIANIGVSPDQASIQVGKGKQFRAFGVNSSSQKTFIAPDSITWSVLGGIGTVTQDGNFTDNAIGTGSIRASYTSGPIGSAVITGTQAVTTHSKWTVLVYLNSANSLQQYSFLNMNQMERVADNPDVRFVVQWKQFPAQYSGGTFNGTRRYLVAPDQTSSIASTLIQDMGTSVDMGSTQTLHDFITWGKANFPADHYCLILWDHGSGWQGPPSSSQAIHQSISNDDQAQSEIEIWNLSQALGSEHFDILACDACDMQMLEVAYEVKDNCDYYVGSEELTPAEGYPYDLVFGPLRDNPDMTPRAFSKSFVDGMLAVPLYNTSKITQGVVDTSQLNSLASAVSTLGTELKNNSSSLTSAIQFARANAASFDVSSSRYYRDLYDLCLKLEANTSIPSVLSATAGVKSAASNAIVWAGHNSLSPASTGLAIDFSTASAFSSQAANYRLLKLGQATQWNEFLEGAP
ncbi:MAG: hypothetical protein JST12_16485 [Armatimonadetes bacterium]|nr:hypothetical protein [Armatimonadota bacterium]